MKIHEYKTGKRACRILRAMIDSTSVLGRIASRWDGELFSTPHQNRIAGWCIEHYRKFDKAPRKGLISYLDAWAETSPDEESLKGTEELLAWIDEDRKEVEKLNPDHIVDRAAKYFDRIRLRRLHASLQADEQAGHIERAKQRIAKHNWVELGVGAGVDLFCDAEAIKSTYAEENLEPLVQYPGDLGKFFGQHLSRDSFIGVMAPEKAGKSYLLLDIAYRAMIQRNKVAYFQVGDLSEWQIKDRLLARAMEAPSKSTREDGKWPCEVRIPVSISHSGKWKEAAEVEFRTKSFDGPFNAQTGWDAAIIESIKEKVKSPKSFFRLCCYPTKTVSVLGIKSVIDSWQKEEWSPDVCVVDYSDILAPVNPKDAPIDQIKTTWEHLRQLSQSLHCLLVTATQVNSASYSKWQLDRSNFAGNHLKLAECTGMIAINVTGTEKERQCARWNWVARREGSYAVRRSVHVAGCLAISNPAMRSIYPEWNEDLEQVQ